MSCKIFGFTGSYQAAFINGVAWNLLNLPINGWLFWKLKGVFQESVIHLFTLTTVSVRCDQPSGIRYQAGTVPLPSLPLLVLL